jgi:hypothetical protein
MLTALRRSFAVRFVAQLCNVTAALPFGLFHASKEQSFVGGDDDQGR